MLIALIFGLHFLFMLVIFTKKWQVETISTAFLDVLLIVILFTVGGAVTNILGNLLIPKNGIPIYYEKEKFNIVFDRANFSLILLTIFEIVGYRYYYKELFTSNEKEK